MDNPQSTDQPTTNNQSIPPPVEPPTSPSPPPVTDNPPPPPITNNPPPTTHNLQPITHISRFAPLLLIPLIITTFATSYFFFSHQRQPKPSSRASAPTPSISLLTTNNPQPTTYNSQPTTHNLSPTITSSGFGTLLPSPTPLSPPPENLPPAIFNITAANDTFTPNQLTARRGQIVTIYISASDKTYDISIPQLGLSRVIQKGDRKSLEFQASSFGQYIFACTSYCNSTTARGILTIKP